MAAVLAAMKRGVLPSEGQERRYLPSTLGWRAVQAYRRVVHSSGFLSSIHSLLVRPAVRLARKLVAPSLPPAASPAAAQVQPARRIMNGSESPWSGDGRRPGMRNEAHRYLKYPLYLPSPALTRRERLMVKLGGGLAKCTVCGRLAGLHIQHDNLRETGLCGRCGSRTRQRQIAFVVCHALSVARNRRIRTMKDVARLDSLVVYNTETKGAIHDLLSLRPDYLCSEYLDPGLQSGTQVGGVMHQDLMALSFGSESIDLVLSSDVFEHVADPYRAHAEIHRVLRPGGRHVFTVPFHQTEFLDEVRATVDERGNVVHLKEPMYHQDPVRLEEGVLVYTLFSVEMLVKLHRLGFRTNMYLLHSHWHGMLGPNGLVFESIKE